MPGYLPSANTKLRGNPRHLSWLRKKARDEARTAFLSAVPADMGPDVISPTSGPFVVAFERRTCYPMDLRNLHAAYKALEDQLVESGYLTDDTSDIVVATPVRQVRVRKKPLQGTLLVLTPDRPEWQQARACIEGVFKEMEE